MSKYHVPRPCGRAPLHYRFNRVVAAQQLSTIRRIQDAILRRRKEQRG
jgi:hypothetical protein